MKKRIAVFITVAGIAAAIFLVVSNMRCGFDSAAWKAQSGNYEDDNPRDGMVASLKKRLRAGMSKQAVLDLLGPPDTIREAGEVYFLGRSAYGVSYEVFVLRYDERDRLVRFYWHRD